MILASSKKYVFAGVSIILTLVFRTELIWMGRWVIGGPGGSRV